MRTRQIGSLDVTVIGLGTNNFGFGMEEAGVGPVVDRAIEAGINFFDTADSYGASEERIGRALKGRRDQVLLATKVGSKRGEGTGGAKRAYVKESAERSLRLLETDHIDLYQLHRPDPETPLAETLEAMGDLVREGKVRELGCSNFSAELLEEAEALAGEGLPRFVSVQNHFNLLNRSDAQDVIPTCERLGVAYLPYFPLASGMLTGKYIRGEAPPEGTRLQRWGERAAGAMSDHTFDVVDALDAWAKDHGHSVLDLAFAWLLAHGVVASVIAGATSPGQVTANAAAADWELSPAERAEVDALVEKVDA